MNEIGVIGLGTMGSALALNLASRGFKVAGYNRTYATTEKIMQKNISGFSGYKELEGFVASLESPRKIILMVPAGPTVDTFIDALEKLIEKNDIIMDAGNSYFKDTIRRSKELTKKGYVYFGVGVSGGEKGALLGPSIMPGGDKSAYESIKPYLEAIAAKKNNDPCCTYIGSDGAGHYVKMVHNGIEYADMQLIAEVYLFLKNGLGLENKRIADIFEDWNNTDVKSYLIEITAKILRVKDLEGETDLVELIVDRASQKGTGKWTILEAIDQGQNVSLIQSAVQARIISNMSEERKTFRNIQFAQLKKISLSEIDITIEEVRKAYSLGKKVAYAQGFAQMRDASDTNGWNLNLKEIASIFRAGCIIQAELLDVLMSIYERNPQIKNFLLDSEVCKEVTQNTDLLRNIVLISIVKGVPAPVFTAALTYIDQLKATSVGANIIQAQRDFFGAHTFERTDKEGAFHYEWENS